MVKHFGSLYLGCEDTIVTLHGLDDANLKMRSKMTLQNEFVAMDRFRSTIKGPEKYKRYLRVDSESLSMLLAKVTLATCYGIPSRESRVYHISEDDEDGTGGDADHKETKRSELDPIGRVRIPHHTDSGYQVPMRDSAECSTMNQDAVNEIGPAPKVLIEADLKTEDEFFGLVKSVESNIPKRRHNDPAFMKMKLGVFEALRDELDVIPDSLSEIQTSTGNTPRPMVAPR